MKNIYAVQSETELSALQSFALEIKSELDLYLSFLKDNYQTVDLPRCIVWTDYETATNSISDLPLPAYTNDYRTVMVPDLDVWKRIYLRQLDAYEENDSTRKVRQFYQNLNKNSVLQILGHEMAHHSDLFLDEAYDEAMWFEEGMVEYISRKYFLTKEEFVAEEEVNRLLVELYEDRNGISDLNDFSASTYQKNISGVLYAYWRSYLAVQKIIDASKGDVASVFASYHRWFERGRKQPLMTWFANCVSFENRKQEDETKCTALDTDACPDRAENAG